MRVLALLLTASLFVLTLACEDSEQEPTPVPTAASTSIPTQTPDMSATVSTEGATTMAVEAPIDATETASVEATKESDPTPTPTPQPALTPDSAPTPTPTATPTPTPTPRPTVTPVALPAKEVLPAATAAAKGAHSGHLEGEFTVEVEFEKAKYVLSISVAGVFHTPVSAHVSATHNIQRSGGVDNNFILVGDQWYGLDHIDSQGWTEEWITVGDHVYVFGPFGDDARHRRGSPLAHGIKVAFELFDLFEFDLLDSDGEISKLEKELDGESVYYLSGPPAQVGSYPVLGRADGLGWHTWFYLSDPVAPDGRHSVSFSGRGIDGVVDYWIGVEDHLLRKLEISAVSLGGPGTIRLNGFVTLSDYGKPVDIRPPVPEGIDDHGNSPATATEIPLGDSVDGVVDSWLDSDYFRFQAEEGRLYDIVASDEVPSNGAYGITTTLLGPDGITPESIIAGSSSWLGGTEFVWQASASGTYYLVVESGHQGMDVYTLAIVVQPDDHGNSPETATEISVGESVDGAVDSRFDSDYFRFQAEEGLLYHLGVSDEGYGITATLLGPDGITPELAIAESSDWPGTRIVWQAPASDTYYLRIIGDNQWVDVYTLTITLLPEEDDYGDSPSTAREVGVGEAVEGMIGHPDDRDYFKLMPIEGQVYRIEVSSHLQHNRPNVALHGPGGPLHETSSIYGPDPATARILWAAPPRGDYYISVELPDSADVGSYTLRVITVTDIVDDHSDGAANATGLSMGETVSGALDYEFDLDYFKFRAEEGQGYKFYKPRTSGSAYLRLYAPDGFTPEPWEKYIWGSDGFGYLWMAREGGTYYLEVWHDSGETGEYSITASPVEAGPDDHGNDAETATDISIGEIVQGNMDHEFDLDYFRFWVNEGQKYRLHVDHQTLEGDPTRTETEVKTYAADGITESSDFSSYSRSSTYEGTTLEWVANISSEQFFEVKNGFGTLGTYTIVVDAVGG